MRREGGWLGIFGTPGEAAKAIELLRGAGCQDVRAAMPTPYPEIERAFGRGHSGLGWVTFTGGITGACCGFLFASWTALDWPLNIGGRPPIALIPYTVIGFECAILFGALTNLTAVLISNFRARRTRAVPTRIEFAADRLGVFVPDHAVGGLSCEALLQQAGALEVEHVGA